MSRFGFSLPDVLRSWGFLFAWAVRFAGFCRSWAAAGLDLVSAVVLALLAVVLLEAPLRPDAALDWPARALLPVPEFAVVAVELPFLLGGRAARPELAVAEALLAVLAGAEVLLLELLLLVTLPPLALCPDEVFPTLPLDWLPAALTAPA